MYILVRVPKWLILGGGGSLWAGCLGYGGMGMWGGFFTFHLSLLSISFPRGGASYIWDFNVVYSVLSCH